MAAEVVEVVPGADVVALPAQGSTGYPSTLGTPLHTPLDAPHVPDHPLPSGGQPNRPGKNSRTR